MNHVYPIVLLRGSARVDWSSTGSAALPLQPNAPGPRIVVPAVKAVPVVVDGKFSPGEWEGAFRQPLGDDFEVYLLADAEYLCVGFKYLKDVQADYLSEVYVATSDRQFINLHSSGSLGEGVNDLPLQGGRTTFTVVAPLGASRAAWWESNAMPRSVAGVQGKEFKVRRARLPGGTVRLAGGRRGRRAAAHVSTRQHPGHPCVGLLEAPEAIGAPGQEDSGPSNRSQHSLQRCRVAPGRPPAANDPLHGRDDSRFARQEDQAFLRDYWSGAGPQAPTSEASRRLSRSSHQAEAGAFRFSACTSCHVKPRCAASPSHSSSRLVLNIFGLSLFTVTARRAWKSGTRSLHRSSIPARAPTCGGSGDTRRSGCEQISIYAILCE